MPAEQSSMSAELLSRHKRQLRIDITRPNSRILPRRDRYRAARTSGAASLVRGLAVPDRCQAKGGARARKRAPGAAVKSNATAASCRNEPKIFGSGNGGICAGVNAPARWMSAQIGQRSSATSLRSARLDGVSSSLEGALAIAVASAEVSAVRSRCTWPNEMASWNASASSARYAPHLARARNQAMVFVLHAVAAQTHSAGTFAR